MESVTLVAVGFGCRGVTSAQQVLEAEVTIQKAKEADVTVKPLDSE